MPTNLVINSEIFLSNINQETSPMITTVNYHQPDVDKPSPSMTEYQSDHKHDPGGVVGTPTIEDQKTASESDWDSDTNESGAKKGDGTLCHDHKMMDSEEKHTALTNNISNHINITGPLTNVLKRKSTESKKLAKKKAPRKEPQQSSDSNWDSDSDSSGNQQLVQDKSMSNDEQRCRKDNLVVTDIKEKVLPVVPVATGIVDHTNEMNKDPQLSDEKTNTKDELLDMVHKIDSDSNWDSDEDCKTKQPENSVQMEKDSSQPEICVSNTNQETSVMIKASSKVDNHQPVDKHSHSLKGYRSDDGQDPGRVITKSTIEGRKSASMSDWDSDTDDADDKKGDGTLCHDHKMRETATVLTITKGENTALTGNDISNHINISVPLTNVITEPKSKEVKTLAIKTTPGNEPHQSSDSNWDSDSELSGDQDKSMSNDEQRVQKANLVVMDIEEDELPVVPVAVVNAAHGSSVDHTNAMNKDPQISDDKLNTKDELLDMVQKIDSDSDWDSDEESETKEPKNSIHIAKDSTKPEICLSKTSQHTSPMITTLPTVNYHQPDVDKPSPLVTENQSDHRHDPGGVDIKPTIEGQKTISESDWDSDTDESGAKKGNGTLCHDHRMKESTTIITIAKEKPIVLTNDISDHINITGPLTNVLPEPKSTKVKTVDKEKTSRKEPQQSSDSNWDSDSDSSGDQPSVQDKSIPNDEQRCQKENLVVTDKKEKILPDVPVAIGIGDHTNEMNKDPQFSDEKTNTRDELLDMVIDSDFDWDSDGESETEKPKNDIYNEKESTQQANLKSLFDGIKEKSLRETAESTGKCIELENQKPSLATSACRSDHKSPEYHEIAGSRPVKCPDSTPVLNWDSDNGDSEDMEKGTILEGHRMKETAEKGNHVLNNTTYHRDNTGSLSDKSPDKRTFIRDETPKGEQHLSSDSNWDSDSDPLEDQLSIEVADHGAVMDHTDGIQKDHQSSGIKPATNEELPEVQSFDSDFDWDSGEESESEKPKTCNSIGKDLTRQAVQKTPSDGNAETSPLKTLEFNVEHHEFEDQKPNSPTSKYKFDHKSSEHCETAGESPVPCPNYTPVSGLDSDIDDLDDIKEKETLTQDMLMSVEGQKRQLANFAVSDVKENVSNSPLAIADDDASSITNDGTHQLHRTNEDKPIAEDGLLDMVQNFDSDSDWDSDEESETEKPKSSNLIEKNSTQHEMPQENKPVSKSVSREVQDSTSDWDSESESEPEKSNVDHQKGNTATVQEFTEKGPDDRGKHSPGSNVAGIVTKQDKRKVFSEIDVSSHCTGEEDVIDGFPKDLQEKQSGYFEPSLSDWGTESTTSDLNEEENKDHLNALVHYISSVHIGWSNEDLTKEKENISKTVAKDEVDEDEIHQRSDASKDSHDLTPTFDTVEVISLIPEKEEKRRDAKSPNSESRIKSDRYQIEIIPSEKLNELTKDGQNIEIEESDDEDISCIDLLDDNSDMKAKSISSEGDFYEDSGASSSNEEKPQNHVSSRSERKAKGIPNTDGFEDFHGYTYETSSDEDQNERNRHETERELLSNKTCVQQNKVLKPDYSDTCRMNKYPETDIVLETGNSQVACGNEEERILPNVKLKDVCVTGKETETIKKNDPVKGKSISILDVNDDDINYLSKAENVKNVKLRSENICDSGEKTSALSHESQVTRILNIDFDEDNSNVAKAKHVEEVQLSDEDFSIPCIHLSDDISGLRNDNNRFSDGDFQDNSSVSLSDEDKPERKIEVGTASSRNLICDESSNIGRTKDVHGFLLDSQHDREPTDCNYLYTYRTIKGLHSAFPDGSCANSSDDEMPTNHGSVRTERKPRGIPSTEDFSDCNGYTYETSSDEDQNERNRHETEKELLGNTTFVQQNKVFKPDSSSPYQMNKYTDTDIVRDTRNSQEAYENEEVCILPNLKFKDVCITGKDTDTTRASDPVQEKSIFTLDFKDDDSNNLPKAENDEKVVELELNADDICGTGAQTKQHGNQSKGTRISNLDFDEDNRNVAKSKRVEEVQSSDEDFSIPCIRLSEDISGLRNDNSISSDGDFQDNSSESSSDEVLQERQIEEDTASSRNEKSLKSLTRDKHTIPLDPEHDIGSTECSNTYRTIKDVLFAPDLMPGQRETTPTSEECMRTAMTSNFMKILMKEEGDRNTSHSHLNESNNSKGHDKSPRRDGGPQRNLPSGGAVQNPTGLSSDVTEIHRLKTISSKITDGEVGIHPLYMGCYQTNCNLGKEQPLQNQYRKEFQPLHDDKIKEESIATQNIRTPSKPTLSKTFTAKYLSKKKGSVGANTSTTEQMISNNDVKLTKQCQKKPVARGRQYTAKYLARHNTTAPLEIPTSNYDTPDVRAEREVDRQNPHQNASNRNRQFTAQYLARRHDQGMSYDTPNERTEQEADCQDPQQIVSHRNRQFTAKYLARRHDQGMSYGTPNERTELEADYEDPQANASYRNRQCTAQYLARRNDQDLYYDTPNERTEQEADYQDPQQIVSHRNRQFTAQYLARRNDQSISNDTPDVKAGRDADCQDPKANVSHRSRQFTAKYLAKRHDQGDFKGGSTAATYPDTMGYWKDIALCESDGGSTGCYNRNEILRCGTHCSFTDAYHRNESPCHDYDFSETNTYNRRDLPYLDTDSSSIYAYQRRETLLPSTRSVNDDTYYCKENPYLDYDCSNVDTYQVNEMPRRISDYQNLGSYHRRDIF